MYRIPRILPFQGGNCGGELFTGRCPELMIMPFQGSFKRRKVELDEAQKYMEKD